MFGVDHPWELPAPTSTTLFVPFGDGWTYFEESEPMWPMPASVDAAFPGSQPKSRCRPHSESQPPHLEPENIPNHVLPMKLFPDIAGNSGVLVHFAPKSNCHQFWNLSKLLIRRKINTVKRRILHREERSRRTRKASCTGHRDTVPWRPMIDCTTSRSNPRHLSAKSRLR